MLCLSQTTLTISVSLLFLQSELGLEVSHTQHRGQATPRLAPMQCVSSQAFLQLFKMGTTKVCLLGSEQYCLLGRRNPLSCLFLSLPFPDK